MERFAKGRRDEGKKTREEEETRGKKKKRQREGKESKETHDKKKAGEVGCMLINICITHWFPELYILDVCVCVK